MEGDADYAAVFKRVCTMKSGLMFLLQYIFKPRTVGAVLPSSRFLARKMVAGINFENAKCVAEFGAGTGVFTEKILERCGADTTVLVFEMNEAFAVPLQEKYAHLPNVKVLCDSAANLGAYLRQHGFEYADYIVSGLPFASLPQEVSHNILKEARRWLRPGGLFVTFQYSLLKKGLIEGYFSDIEIGREFRNVPPAYVLRCGNATTTV